MGERVTISYRGTAYELGRGKRCYGIWATGAPRSEPVERWPETPDGWIAAWTRFTAMETPGTITAVGQHEVPNQTGPAAFGSAGDTVAFGRQTATTGRTALGAAGSAVAAALLAVGVILGVVGLFPHYQADVSLAATPADLIPHVAYLAVWTIAAVLIVLRPGAVARAGALLAVGTSVVTFGLFGADLGQGTSVASAGLWISLVGWLACTAGAVLAFRTAGAGVLRKRGIARPAGRGIGRPAGRGIGRPGGRGIARAALLIVAGFGVSLSFFPNWDSYLLRASTGQSEAQALGSVFASTQPGWVQAADLAVMVLFVLVVIAAALWRPLAAGAMLLAGAVIPMAAQAISGIVGATEPTSPLVFGISASQAQQLGLTITNGLTPVFWIFCLCVVILLVSCAWMFMAPADQSKALAAEPAGPVDEQPAGPAEGPVADPAASAPGQQGDAWTERELAADSWDD